MSGLFGRVLFLHVFLLLSAVLAGCTSGIKTYDSTFTAQMPLAGVNAFAYSKKQIASYRGALPKRVSESRKKPYFVEFRARHALTYGHAFIVFGELDKNGKVPTDAKGVLIPGKIEITGLHPASRSTVPWSVGHVVPVPAETGPSDGDFETEYLLSSYRIDLTETQFRRLVALVHDHKKKGTFWFGPAFACTHYINGIARDLGMKVPRKPMLPKNYVNTLKSLNGENPRILL